MGVATATKLGPGTLTIGAAGSIIDISCRMSAAQVKWNKNKDDDVEVLCGDTIAGAVTYTSTLAGTIAQDLDDDNGLVVYSWDHKGEQVPFVFVPNTTAGKQVTGTLTLDPLDVGGTEVKKNMMSDFEWDIVGEPVLSGYTPPVTATGATAGTPGTFTPTGATPPADLATLNASSIAPSPVTAWPTGSYVALGDASHAYWDGATWQSGQAP